jgi:hypothetical protein
MECNEPPANREGSTMLNNNRNMCPVALLTLCAFAAMTPHPACAQSAGPGVPHAGGIWKAAVPLTVMHGEFDNFDPLGVAAGARIKSDCSLNWVNPDDGKLYCFSSGTSLEFFLDQPHANIARARAAWRKQTTRDK